MKGGGKNSDGKASQVDIGRDRVSECDGEDCGNGNG